MKYYFSKDKVIECLNMDDEIIERNRWMETINGKEVKFEKGKSVATFGGLLISKEWCITQKEKGNGKS